MGRYLGTDLTSSVPKDSCTHPRRSLLKSYRFIAFLDHVVTGSSRSNEYPASAPPPCPAMSAGDRLTVVLCSDGTAKAYGRNHYGQRKIPRLKEGVSYTQVALGRAHTVLLCSDGNVVARGLQRRGRRHRQCQRCSIPPLCDGLTYTQVSAGDAHTVCLRSDGTVCARGLNDQHQCNVPDRGSYYYYIGGFVQVSAGGFHTLLLHQTDTVYARGRNCHGQCNVPVLPVDVGYSQVSAGRYHSVFLLRDGTAVACGNNDEDQCMIPPLSTGQTYTSISAGHWHTLLLRSDGGAVGCGLNDDGQCDIPALEEDVIYTHVSAGAFHSFLLRSDGSAVAFGRSHYGECSLLPLEKGLSYVPCELATGDFVVMLSIELTAGAMRVSARGMGGDALATLKIPVDYLDKTVHSSLIEVLDRSCRKLVLVSPGGKVLLRYQTWKDLVIMEAGSWQPSC